MKIEIKGTSMVPALNHGDKVEIELCQGGNLKKGDIIAFWRDSSLFVHRFYGRKNGMFITKGDRCRGFDLPVSEERIIGRLVGKGNLPERNIRYFRNLTMSTVYALKARMQMAFL